MESKASVSRATIRRCHTPGCTMPSYTVQESGFCRNCERKNNFARTRNAQQKQSSRTPIKVKTESEFTDTLSKSYKRISRSAPREVSSSEPRSVRRSPSSSQISSQQRAAMIGGSRPKRPSHSQERSYNKNSLSSPLDSGKDRSFIKTGSIDSISGGDSHQFGRHVVRTISQPMIQSSKRKGSDDLGKPMLNSKATMSQPEYGRPVIKNNPRIDMRGSPSLVLKKGISFEETAGQHCRTTVKCHFDVLLSLHTSASLYLSSSREYISTFQKKSHPYLKVHLFLVLPFLCLLLFKSKLVVFFFFAKN